jgi:hypothetical protein
VDERQAPSQRELTDERTHYHKKNGRNRKNKISANTRTKYRTREIDTVFHVKNCGFQQASVQYHPRRV